MNETTYFNIREKETEILFNHAVNCYLEGLMPETDPFYTLCELMEKGHKAEFFWDGFQTVIVINKEKA